MSDVGRLAHFLNRPDKVIAIGLNSPSSANLKPFGLFWPLPHWLRRCADESKDTGSIPCGDRFSDGGKKEKRLYIEASAHVIDPEVTKVTLQLQK